ncbi:c2h2-type zinc finger transcription factor [Gigaspora margarita]|uniref:C2h2-type zinc finger transcription factor n=1 Tax=Gigaspora margarita TaxID=4874 RepID=A0A8H3XF00_GIGMA|nr:c2h2-type zinc finger transcription factor [Gigaspora margarita]
MSLASSDIKNDTSCDMDQKTIGEKRDGTLYNNSCDMDVIFRLKGDRLEFGAIEAGRKLVLEGYICQAQRLDFYEVAGHINDPPLAFVINDVLRAKAIIMQTLNLVQQGKMPNLDSLDDSDDDDKVERSNQRTTPPPIALPSTFKTFNTARTKDGQK